MVKKYNGNPQVEDGHTQIANELLEALSRFRMPGECRQVFDAIIRHTYGWKETHGFMSTSLIEDRTGLKRRHVQRALTSLESHKIIYKTIRLNPKVVTQKGYDISVTKNGYDNRNPKRLRKLGAYTMQDVGINKHYSDWIPYKKLVTQNGAHQINTNLFERKGAVGATLGACPPAFKIEIETFVDEKGVELIRLKGADVMPETPDMELLKECIFHINKFYVPGTVALVYVAPSLSTEIKGIEQRIELAYGVDIAGFRSAINDFYFFWQRQCKDKS